MSSNLVSSGHGFNRLVFKVDGGRNGMSVVTVLISVDAHRKLLNQLLRSKAPAVDRLSLMKVWARWALALRLEDTGMLPATVTITASDIDDFGAYASDLARTLMVA